MDITQLPAKWRREAASHPQISRLRLKLQNCADELELALHQDAHDAEFYSGCRFCDWEREHNDNYPEPR